MTRAGSRRTRSRAVLAVAAAALALGGSGAEAAEGRAAPVEVVGKLPILYPGGYPGPHVRSETAAIQDVALVVNPARRRAYELFHLDAPSRTAIRAFDLDTLRPLGPDGPGAPGYGEVLGLPQRVEGTVGDFVYALDDPGGRLFLLGQERDRQTFVWAMDLARLDRGGDFATRFDLPAETLADPAAPKAYDSISYYTDRRTGAGKLLLLYGGTYGSPVPGPEIVRWDAGTGAQEWRYRPPGGNCPLIGHMTSGHTQATKPAFWRSTFGDFLYLLCQDGNGESSEPRVRIVRVPLDPEAGDRPFDPTLRAPEQFQGPSDGGFLESLADPRTDRVIIVTLNCSKGATLWVFDGRAGALAGGAGFLPEGCGALSYALGIDPSSGRAYALASDYPVGRGARVGDDIFTLRGGLFLLDPRLTPINQALQFPEMAYPSRGRVGVDPGGDGRPARVFMRRAGQGSPHDCWRYPYGHVVSDRTPEGGCPPDHFYTVLGDHFPIPRQPLPSDQDVNTQAVVEREGVTGRTFEASGSAWGVRVRLVGGLRSVQARQRDELINGVLKYEGALPLFPDGGPTRQKDRYVEPACWGNDREAGLARVQSAIVSEREATVIARPLEADPSSREDLRSPAARCRPLITPRDLPTGHRIDNPDYAAIDSVTDARWTVEDASCSGDAEDVARVDSVLELPNGGRPVKVPAGPLHDMEARASCEQSAHTADAEARGGPAQVSGVVVVGETFADVRVEPLEGGGERVVAVAEVRDIRIGDVFIDVARATAVSRAAGRPGTARTEFVRELCGVHVPGLDPTTCYSDADAACDVDVPALPPETEGLPAQMREQLQGMRNSLAAEQAARCADPLAWIVDKINQRLRSDVEIFLRRPDPVLAAGTPKGYLAAIQKEETQTVNDTLILRDFAREVPALEITTYRDSNVFGTGRQIILLAGVRAATSYGTYCLPPLVPSGEACVEGAPADAAPTPRRSEPVGGGTPRALAGPIGGRPEPAYLEVPNDQAPQPPLARVRSLLVRSMREGLLTTGAWFVIGLPFYLATRRMSAARRASV